MKKTSLVLALILLVFTTMLTTGCSKVPNGHEGVIVKNMASNAENAITPRNKIGYFFLAPTQELYLFPTFTQQYSYTQTHAEGKAADEAFRIQFQGGAQAICDIGISWFMRPGESVKAFKKYRQGAEEITHITLRRILRDAFQIYGPLFTVEDMYSGKVPVLMDSVTAFARREVGPYGIQVEQVALLKAPTWDAKIKATMEAKIEAVQNAIKVENEVRTIQAEAEKKIAAARGDSASVVIQAQGKAEAVRIQSQRWGSPAAYLEFEKHRMWSAAWEKGGSPMPTTVMGGQGTPPILYNLGK